LLFNSYVFLLLFLPTTWILYRMACNTRCANFPIIILVAASIIFYSYWNPKFSSLIGLSIAINFCLGRVIMYNFKNNHVARYSMYFGVALNLFLIGYFKYANFFMYNLTTVFGWSWTAKDIFLPLGISFFTFQQIAYLVDCYKGLAGQYKLIHYALFVTFFPQLIAGPIVRYDQIMPQFTKTKTFELSYKNLVLGLSLFSLGLFKKLFIADTLALWVTAVFDSASSLSFFEAWGGALCYTFQIYFDFSGYSDMAIGLGWLFNIDLPINFDSPYKSTSISEFWRRWHISLSTFLRDYLYIPLGGNRKGGIRRYSNLMVTMLLGGLWHGASWNFVLWGGLHGLYLWVNHGFRRVFQNDVHSPLSKILGWGSTFFAVVIAWVLFRAPSLSRATEILWGMMGKNGFVLPPHWVPFAALQERLEDMGIKLIFKQDWTFSGPRKDHLFVLLVLAMSIVISLCFKNSYQYVVSNNRSFNYVVCAILLVISLLFINKPSEFLYFQF